MELPEYVDYFNGQNGSVASPAMDNRTTSNRPVVMDLTLPNCPRGQLHLPAQPTMSPTSMAMSLLFFFDNSSTPGEPSSSTTTPLANFTYIADGGLGPDNFSYFVVDNYSAESQHRLSSSLRFLKLIRLLRTTSITSLCRSTMAAD